jgi:hypothetical protein
MWSRGDRFERIDEQWSWYKQQRTKIQRTIYLRGPCDLLFKELDNELITEERKERKEEK